MWSTGFWPVGYWTVGYWIEPASDEDAVIIAVAMTIFGPNPNMTIGGENGT